MLFFSVYRQRNTGSNRCLHRCRSSVRDPQRNLLFDPAFCQWRTGRSCRCHHAVQTPELIHFKIQQKNKPLSVGSRLIRDSRKEAFLSFSDLILQVVLSVVCVRTMFSEVMFIHQILWCTTYSRIQSQCMMSHLSYFVKYNCIVNGIGW